MATSLDSFNDLKELGIDCEDSDSLTDAFNKAANHLPNLLPNVDNHTLLSLYGYYKQGSQGPCNTPKPSWFDMKAKSKWEAWSKLGDMPQNKAKQIYIETIKTLDPTFNVPEKESWVSVSVPQNLEGFKEAKEKTVADFVKEENYLEVAKLLESPSIAKDLINKLDEEGLGLIHWAADRGSVDILELLFKCGANVDLQDSDGQTALHYASSCGHLECIKILLTCNARRDIVDGEGLSPEDVACDDAVKELLVNFK
ncbi:acyl-CoA-binding domain-containing protein 6 [Tribolium castaneum]|uniref:Acyl-CoA-binding domain-containing protein 6 n=1 Tax=Tribolium castaneum TaxID=7070 RepID=D7EHR2_TRICA|nr:PREDICTED: acyl-CoA-binding domain-containing protein 6 [Tribolium castaneum]EFA12151.1 Acyl-CoA-binding domain-containing protein 6-like Protein [Tribolium castaneum]|eukprot:XP_970549.1 PREDICTED: acyl-CoA-binding domain-containing protein 6 [Tribolium castaneum]